MIRETYRGVALKVTPRGLGQVEEFVGGRSQGVWRGTEADRMKSLKGWVDAAGENPHAYAEEFRPTTPLRGCIRCEEPLACDGPFCQTCIIWSQDYDESNS